MQSPTVDDEEVANALTKASLPKASDHASNIPAEASGSAPPPTATLSNSNSSSDGRKRKRSVCTRCDRPTPSACICSALPDERIRLQRCRCLVLQHPHEVRRKNRSLPLVEYCLDAESLVATVGRRFGTSKDKSVHKLLQEPPEEKSTPIWLFYPGPDAISFSQALEQHQSTSTENSERITLLFLDATWKYAKEMHHANTQFKQYPDHMLRVQLSETDLENVTPRRFDIRTPLSDNHLSTAECLAWVIAKVEEKQEIYDTIMKPLDLMVNQWHSFSDQKKRPKDDSQGSLGNEQQAIPSPADKQQVAEKE
jgi:DTW domain-containing protein YfiP